MSDSTSAVEPTSVDSSAAAPVEKKAVAKKATVKKATKKATVKKATKKAVVKKTVKKAVVKESSPTARTAPTTPSEIRWTDKRVRIFRTLKKLGAIDASSARDPELIASKAGVDTKDVIHYLYKDNDIRMLGLVDVTKHEGSTRQLYFLTKLGNKFEPVPIEGK